MYGLGEFNDAASWLIGVAGPVPAIAAMKTGLAGLILAFYLLYRRFRSYPFYAIYASYAAFSWVPGLHNLLLLYGVPSNPVLALVLQFSASFALYLRLVHKHYARRRSRRLGAVRQGSRRLPLTDG